VCHKTAALCKTSAHVCPSEGRYLYRVCGTVCEMVRFRYSLSNAEMKRVMPYLPTILQKNPSSAPHSKARCPYPANVACSPVNVYRSYDGRCNNLKKPLWGSAHQPLTRYMPPDYADGKKVLRCQPMNLPGEMIKYLSNKTRCDRSYVRYVRFSDSVRTVRSRKYVVRKGTYGHTLKIGFKLTSMKT